MMRSFCDDQIINQAICYFTVVICYVDCFVVFSNFCASEKANASIWKMSESRVVWFVLKWCNLQYTSTMLVKRWSTEKPKGAHLNKLLKSPYPTLGFWVTRPSYVGGGSLH